MAYSRIEGAGGLPGPWGVEGGDGSSWGEWSGDEETLPLISLDEELDPGQGTVPLLTGPWNPETTNPFVNSLWIPLKPSNMLQESLNPFIGVNPVGVEVAINTEPFDLPQPTRPLFGEQTAPKTEPSQREICLLSKSWRHTSICLFTYNIFNNCLRKT